MWATDGLLPDLTILLDIDEKVGRERLDTSRTRYDRLEAEEQEFHALVRAAYLELAGAEPERFLVVDATAAADEIAVAVRERVLALLSESQ